MQRTPKKQTATLLRQNLRLVKELHPTLGQKELLALRNLTRTFELSILAGELLLLDGHWYVTHAALLRVARRNGCRGIRVQPLRVYCDPPRAARRQQLDNEARKLMPLAGPGHGIY